MIKYIMENYHAKKSDEISHTISITYKSYFVRKIDGALLQRAQDENIDRLLKKSVRHYDKDSTFIIKKIVKEVSEEPVFKVRTPTKNIIRIKEKRERKKTKSIQERKKR